MKKIILTGIILSLLVQIGCGSDLSNDMVETDEAKNIAMKVGSEDKSVLDRSENLSDFIVELFGVDDVSTIILNDTAVVGVVMAYDSQLTDDTRELISGVVMENDLEIKQVVISDDDKIFNEIVYIINDLMNGKKYDNYVDSISKIIEKVNKKY